VKILLDECVPLPLRDLLGGHDSISVQQRGWTGIKNGDLLRLAAREFELFITSDQSIRYEQNLVRAPIAILELSTNDLRRIRASAAMIQSEVTATRTGELPFHKSDGQDYRGLMIVARRTQIPGSARALACW